MIKIKEICKGEFSFSTYGMKIYTGLYSKEAADMLEQLFDIRFGKTRFIQGSEEFRVQEFIDYDIEVVTTGHLARKYGLTLDPDRCLIKRIFREPDGEIVFFADWTAFGYWNIMKYLRLLTGEWLCEFGQNDEKSVVVQKLCSLFLEPLRDRTFGRRSPIKDDECPCDWMTNAFGIDFWNWHKIDYSDIIGKPCDPFVTEVRKNVIDEFTELTIKLYEIEDDLNSNVNDRDTWNELYAKYKPDARKYVIKIDKLYKQIMNV